MLTATAFRAIKLIFLITEHLAGCTIVNDNVGFYFQYLICKLWRTTIFTSTKLTTSIFQDVYELTLMFVFGIICLAFTKSPSCIVPLTINSYWQMEHLHYHLIVSLIYQIYRLYDSYNNVTHFLMPIAIYRLYYGLYYMQINNDSICLEANFHL